jgi:hypothetical protein
MSIFEFMKKRKNLRRFEPVIQKLGDERISRLGYAVITSVQVKLLVLNWLRVTLSASLTLIF